MSKNLLQTSVNLRKMSKEASLTLEKLNGIIDDVEFENSVADVLISDSIAGLQMKNILYSLEASSNKLVSISNSLDSLSSNISKGKGTLNYIATDTNLVARLERTMINIEEGTARFNENMEALKHNFLTRRYFKKQEKEEREKQ